MTNKNPKPDDYRECCECGELFVPYTERQIRCVPCQVADDFG